MAQYVDFRDRLGARANSENLLASFWLTSDSNYDHDRERAPRRNSDDLGVLMSFSLLPFSVTVALGGGSRRGLHTTHVLPSRKLT